jgi:receptor protein-tyrosine kinase
VVSYSRLVHSSTVLRSAIDRSDVDISEEDLDDRVSATATPDSALMVVSVSYKDEVGARRLAGNVAAAMSTGVAQLETPVGGGQPNARLAVLSGPSSSSTPVSPSRTLNIGIGIVLGLIIGVVGALSAERLNNRIRSVDDLRRLTGSAPLASIPAERGFRTSPAVVFGGPETRRAREFRRLRNAVLGPADAGSVNRQIVVTSPRPGEGKSIVALNLSAALAETGRSVCLITPSAQLAMLRQSATVDLPASLVLESVESALPYGAEQKSLASLGSEFDVVVLDGDALLSGSLAETGVRSASMVLLVARQRRTRVSELISCGERLSVIGVPGVGVVMNGVRNTGLDIAKSTRSGVSDNIDRTSRAGETDQLRSAAGRHSPS